MLKVGGAQSVSLSDTNYCGLYRLVWAGLVLTSLNMESSTNFCQPFLFFVPFANQVGWFLPASAIAPFHACRRIMQQIADDCPASFVPSCRDLLGHNNTTLPPPPSPLSPEMIIVKNFTQPDFQNKSFTPQKCVICDIFLAN